MDPPNSTLFTVLCKSLWYLVSIWFGHDYFFFVLIWFTRLCRASTVNKLSFTPEYITQFPSMQYLCCFSLLLFWLLLMCGYDLYNAYPYSWTDGPQQTLRPSLTTGIFYMKMQSLLFSFKNLLFASSHHLVVLHHLRSVVNPEITQNFFCFLNILNTL